MVMVVCVVLRLPNFATKKKMDNRTGSLYKSYWYGIVLENENNQSFFFTGYYDYMNLFFLIFFSGDGKKIFSDDLNHLYKIMNRKG